MPEVEILQQKNYNFLWVDGALWMWDIPVEQEAQESIAQKAFNDVLVAGYGLGIVQRHLLENPKVNSVLTVEKIPGVINECKRTYGKLFGDVEIGDFYKYHSDKRFDCIIGDMWEDMIPNSLKLYKKFKDKAQELIKPDGKILAWGRIFLNI